MIFKDDEAAILAGFLLQIKAIKLSPAKPFTWASGLKSPIYCDNRITLSYPKIRTHIRQQFVQAILEKYDKPDIIVGVATGGIAQGALIAQELGLPFAYVRSDKKSHGLHNEVEGIVEKGQSAVVIEDLVSTGGSSLKAVDAMRQRGLEVKGMMAIFTYGLQQSEENFKTAKCELTTLTDYESLIRKASEENYITEKDLQSLIQWRLNPEAWSNEQ
ncbi:MAG: orotate phosphoribosyltransferase [Bacteroidales bacterium]|jgi:orotate phosphoribosyltransferase|nr:orotate phosphoribosyltransferase [Bacteroidales bacterium]MDD4087059.1 orotate phosphoribosyltransferase [Bacteroidales bacterium]MDY0085535.1 orotate phosphoribosyltransferase [Bacteroidales bacterium]